MHNPTTQTATFLSTAYDVFNQELFNGQLPPCLITMQRHKGAYGYFCGERFQNTSQGTDVTDEIALNPTHFAHRGTEQVLSTLVHEMVHLWQHHYGKASRASYHNRQWAGKMREIGLIPTDTGKEDGKETGQTVTHLIQEGGSFQKACTKLLALQPAILYADRLSSEREKTRTKKLASKTKYTCPSCKLHAWAKPDAPLECGKCNQPMQHKESAEYH